MNKLYLVYIILGFLSRTSILLDTVTNAKFLDISIPSETFSIHHKTLSTKEKKKNEKIL
jgi:hypothetical protein